MELVSDSGQNVSIHQRIGKLRRLRRQPGDASRQPRLWSNRNLSAVVEHGGVDAVGGVLRGGGDDGCGGGEVEPAAFKFDVADELSVSLAAGAHQAGADGGDADSFVAEFGVEAFGESDQRELCGGVRQHVRHGQFAADGGDIDDAGASLAG